MVLDFFLHIVFYLFNLLFILTKIITLPGVGVGVVVSVYQVDPLPVGLYPMIFFPSSNLQRAFIYVSKRVIHWLHYLDVQ